MMIVMMTSIYKICLHHIEKNVVYHFLIQNRNRNERIISNNLNLEQKKQFKIKNDNLQ